jgi:hypothetical protein
MKDQPDRTKKEEQKKRGKAEPESRTWRLEQNWALEVICPF